MTYTILARFVSQTLHAYPKAFPTFIHYIHNLSHRIIRIFWFTSLLLNFRWSIIIIISPCLSRLFNRCSRWRGRDILICILVRNCFLLLFISLHTPRSSSKINWNYLRELCILKSNSINQSSEFKKQIYVFNCSATQDVQQIPLNALYKLRLQTFTFWHFNMSSPIHLVTTQQVVNKCKFTLRSGSRRNLLLRASFIGGVRPCLYSTVLGAGSPGSLTMIIC